jgi:alpha-tubulin suppressor-like RCC1 family protein
MHTRTSRVLAAAAAAVAILSGAARLAAAAPASAAAAAAAPGARPALAAPVAFGWGNNDLGQIGDGTTKEKDTAEQIPLSGTPVQVTSAFGVTGAALLSNGTVETWGNDFQGQLGTGPGSGAASVPVPAVVPGLGGITQLVGGDDFFLALTSSGTVWSWGNDGSGALGYGTPGSIVDVPHQVPGLTGITQVAAGDFDGVALGSDGTVWTWGGNLAGELGNGTTTAETAPQQVAGVAGITQVAAGGETVFALSQDGMLLGWGSGSDGVLGIGDGADRRHPAVVPGISDVQQVSTSGLTTLAIAGLDRNVYGWGFNTQGQVGDGSTTARLVPAFTDLIGINEVSAGQEVSAAVRHDGTLLVWGANDNGSVANGTSRTNQLAPAAVAGITDVTSVSVNSGLGLAVGRVPLPPAPTSGAVPRVTGDLQAAATTAIQDAGFTLGTATSSPDRTCNSIGRVLSQNPPAGTTEPFGTAVSIVVGTRPATPCP